MAPSSLLSDASSSATARLLPFRASAAAPRIFRCHPSPSLPPIPSKSVPTRLTLSCRSSSSSVFGVTATDTGASAKVIDGKLVSKQVKDEVAEEIARLKAATGHVPGLAVILVGSRKDSQTYVRNKKKACEAVGIKSFEVNLPEDATEEEVIKHISEFNNDSSVHGILVQLPLPRHVNEETILGAVNIEKDVDGFHPLNIGRLAMQRRYPLFVPCTPKGCMELLHRYGVEIKGKRAVVIGRSNIVGMPAALLLQKANATVSIVHSNTKNPEEITRQADIVIAAVGVANLVRGSVSLQLILFPGRHLIGTINDAGTEDDKEREDTREGQASEKVSSDSVDLSRKKKWKRIYKFHESVRVSAAHLFFSIFFQSDGS